MGSHDCHALVFLLPLLTLTAATYTEKTDSDSPFDDVKQPSGWAASSCFDMDGDGDTDCVVGSASTTPSGQLWYYENDGSSTAPTYSRMTGSGNDPFWQSSQSLIVGISGSASSKQYLFPECFDMDDDGDIDCVVGNQAGELRYLENTGSSTAPAYEEKTGSNNPFDGMDVDELSKPSCFDMDGDGDIDCLIGNKITGTSGDIKYYENTGTATAAAYTEKTGSDNPFNGVDIRFPAPDCFDEDGDSDYDCVIGSLWGTLSFYENTGSSTAATYTEKTGSNNPFNGITVSAEGRTSSTAYMSTPDCFDMNGDSATDCLVGDYRGFLNYYENDGTKREVSTLDAAKLIEQ